MVAEPAGAAVDPGLHLHAGGEPLYGLTAMRSAYVGRTDGWMDGRTDSSDRSGRTLCATIVLLLGDWGV